MVFAVRYSTELASPTHRAGCLKTCSPMAAHIHYWLNTTDRPCLFTLCTLQIGCCRGERVRSWISLQKLLLKIPRSMRRLAPKRKGADKGTDALKALARARWLCKWPSRVILRGHLGKLVDGALRKNACAAGGTLPIQASLICQTIAVK